jgi:hypothetical protein
MPKDKKKGPKPAHQAQYDPKFDAHAYAARLARQVTAELEPLRKTSRPNKKQASKRH